MQRHLKTYGKYFLGFYNSLGKEVQEKIDWVFEIVKVTDQIPKKFFEAFDRHGRNLCNQD